MPQLDLSWGPVESIAFSWLSTAPIAHWSAIPRCILPPFRVFQSVELSHAVRVASSTAAAACAVLSAPLDNNTPNPENVRSTTDLLSPRIGSLGCPCAPAQLPSTSGDHYALAEPRSRKDCSVGHQCHGCTQRSRNHRRSTIQEIDGTSATTLPWVRRTMGKMVLVATAVSLCAVQMSSIFQIASHSCRRTNSQKFLGRLAAPPFSRCCHGPMC